MNIYVDKDLRFFFKYQCLLWPQRGSRVLARINLSLGCVHDPLIKLYQRDYSLYCESMEDYMTCWK